MKERKLGEVFTTKRGAVLQVVEALWTESCRKCYYQGKPKCEKVKCLSFERQDSTSVLFLKLPNNEPYRKEQNNCMVLHLK